MFHYIYRHIRPDTGEVFYIGRGLTDTKWYNSKQGRNKVWKEIVKLNNGSYTIQIMLDELTLEEAIDKEQEFIELYRKIEDGGTLCNISSGGGSGTIGMKHTEESRSKMSAAAKGRKWSDAARIQYNKTRKGVSINNGKPREDVHLKAWEASSKPVQCTITGKIYGSLKEGAASIGLNYSTAKSRIERGSHIGTFKYIN